LKETGETEYLRSLISENYDIGELIEARRSARGYVNTSYEIITGKNGRDCRYFLRRYREDIEEKEVRFEHSIIEHLMSKNFRAVAGLVYTREGRSYVRRFVEEQSGGEPLLFALFDFLPGEDRYTWDNPACKRKEIESAAALLARYHDTVSDLTPSGRRKEARIIDLLHQLGHCLRNWADMAGTTVFDACFLANFDYMLNAVRRIRASIEGREYERMVQLPIHCDYHPGNLKFQEEKATGLFDFDWSKIDARCFDVALGITYFCSEWGRESEGGLRLDKITIFLSSYQKALQEGELLRPLDEAEIRYLPSMIGASNAYILRWVLGDFYAKRGDPQRYLLYLQHSMELMRWFESRSCRTLLEETIMESSEPAACAGS